MGWVRGRIVATTMFLLDILGGEGLRLGRPLIFSGTVLSVLCFDVFVLWWYNLKCDNYRVYKYWLASQIRISNIYVKHIQ